MSAQILEIASESAVDSAWNDYADEARRLITNPELISNRVFNESLARKHRAWLRLFYIQDAAP